MGNTQLLAAGRYYCPKGAAPFLWTPKLRTSQYKARFGLFFNKKPNLKPNRVQKAQRLSTAVQVSTEPRHRGGTCKARCVFGL